MNRTERQIVGWLYAEAERRSEDRQYSGATALWEAANAIRKGTHQPAHGDSRHEPEDVRYVIKDGDIYWGQYTWRRPLRYALGFEDHEKARLKCAEIQSSYPGARVVRVVGR